MKNVDEMSIAELEAYLKKGKAAELKKVEKPKPKIEKVPITKKLSKILSKSGKVITYPKNLVSIAEMRENELDQTTIPGKLKLTFAELFEKQVFTEFRHEDVDLSKTQPCKCFFYMDRSNPNQLRKQQ